MCFVQYQNTYKSISGQCSLLTPTENVKNTKKPSITYSSCANIGINKIPYIYLSSQYVLVITGAMPQKINGTKKYQAKMERTKKLRFSSLQVVQIIVRQLFLLYLWPIKPKPKCCIVSLSYFRDCLKKMFFFLSMFRITVLFFLKNESSSKREPPTKAEDIQMSLFDLNQIGEIYHLEKTNKSGTFPNLARFMFVL